MNKDDPGHFELVPPEDSLERLAPELSPAVRRLVKQYGLDATSIRGTGPDGRLRVTDVMAVLGNRGAPIERGDDERLPDAPRAPHTAELPLTTEPTAAPAAAFSVFEIELDSWLEHRERERAAGREHPLAAYFIAASIGPLMKLPSVAGECTSIDVLRSTESGTSRARVALRGAESLTAITESLRRQAPVQEAAPFALHDYGATGCLFASPLPLDGRAAVLGVGRPRRHAARSVQVYITLGYDPARLALEDANRFLAGVARYRPAVTP